MSLQVGTLVKMFNEDDEDKWHFPCEEYNNDFTRDSDIPRKLYVCVGMIQEFATDDEPIAAVHWLTQCGYHRLAGRPTHENVNVDNLWEVGQLD